MRERKEGKPRHRKRRKDELDEGMPVVGSSPEEAGRQVYPPVPGQPEAAPGWPPPTAEAAPEAAPATQAPPPVETVEAPPPTVGFPPPVPPPAPPPEPPPGPRPTPPAAPTEPAPAPAPPPEIYEPPPAPPQPPPVTAPAAPEPEGVPPLIGEAERPAAGPEQPVPGREPAAHVPPQVDQPPPPMPPGPVQPPGYMYPPAPWYPVPYMPPGLGMYQPPVPYPGAPPPGMPPDQTGQIPVMQPPAVPPIPPGVGIPPGPGFPPAQFPPPPLQSLEDEEFGELSRPEPGHWRGDLKWIFGIITTLLLFLTLAAAGAYRATAPGAAKEVLVPLIENATEVKQAVKDNYQQLRSRARRIKSGSVVIPDIDMSISVESSQVNSLSSEELADVVVLEVERQVYTDGYSGDLPMEAARGTGEERAKAVAATLLSELNKSNHETLLWVLIISGALTLAFAVLFVVFCRGWGRVTGMAIVIISASLPASLAIRFSSEFIWRSGAGGPYRSAVYQALRSLGSLTVVFFDAALALGALVLLVGVIGGILSRRSRERVPPFKDLRRPERSVVEEPGLEPGPAQEQREDDLPLEAFKDLEPPPG